jgi:hypothetical protein
MTATARRWRCGECGWRWCSQAAETSTAPPVASTGAIHGVLIRPGPTNRKRLLWQACASMQPLRSPERRRTNASSRPSGQAMTASASGRHARRRRPGADGHGGRRPQRALRQAQSSQGSRRPRKKASSATGARRETSSDARQTGQSSGIDCAAPPPAAPLRCCQRRVEGVPPQDHEVDQGFGQQQQADRHGGVVVVLARGAFDDRGAASPPRRAGGRG